MKKKNIRKNLFHAPTMLFMLFINKFMNVQTKRQCKMSQSKKFTCKGTSQQVIIRDFYRLETHKVMLVFLTQCCELLHL